MVDLVELALRLNLTTAQRRGLPTLVWVAADTLVLAEPTGEGAVMKRIIAA
jgi:hypothetical protein